MEPREADGEQDGGGGAVLHDPFPVEGIISYELHDSGAVWRISLPCSSEWVREAESGSTLTEAQHEVERGYDERTPVRVLFRDEETYEVLGEESETAPDGARDILRVIEPTDGWVSADGVAHAVPSLKVGDAAPRLEALASVGVLSRGLVDGTPVYRIADGAEETAASPFDRVRGGVDD